jgi:hypothetical protein
MKIEQIVCDECKRVRGESNHWHKIGVLRNVGTTVQLTLGVIPEKPMPGFEVHDLCGESCFHKHIDNLLGLRGGVVESDPQPLPINNDVLEMSYSGV